VKDFTLGELFSEEQLQRAKDICLAEHGNAELHARLTALAEEALPHINAVTGRSNHAGYFGYVLEHAFTRRFPDA
jgi:hypothetical protein